VPAAAVIQGAMLEATILASTGVGVTIAFGSTRYFTAIQNVGRVKSSVDDLTMERGQNMIRNLGKRIGS